MVEPLLAHGTRFVIEPANAWWHDRRTELLRHSTSPAYVYDVGTVDAAARRLAAMQTPSRILYAMKANPNRALMACIRDVGLGFECVSVPEVARARSVLADADCDAPILFTPNFAARTEYAEGFELGAIITLDNLHPLEHWPRLFAGREVFVRVDPGHGHGHHAHVRTGGTRSKFGVSIDQMDHLERLADAADCRVVGLHAHVGSGVRDAHAWTGTARFLAGIAARFPHVRVLDLGGGLGIPEKPGQSPLDLAAVDAALASVRTDHPELEIWLEPGRYLVAEAGVLLATVTQRKTKGPQAYVGVDAGMNTLIRPALYGAWHEIVNLTRLDRDGPVVEMDVVGPICETGDVLGHGRHLVDPHEGDVLLIGTAGAYGRAMSSHYNLREPAAEIPHHATETNLLADTRVHPDLQDTPPHRGRSCHPPRHARLADRPEGQAMPRRPSLADHTEQELRDLIDLARMIKANLRAFRDACEGRTLAMIFTKPSLRAREFQTGIYQLGGRGHLGASDPLHRGESIGDTATVLGRFVDGIMARVHGHDVYWNWQRPTCPSSTAFPTSITRVRCSGSPDDQGKAHPRGKTLAYIGDGNNMSHSLMFGAAIMGMHIRIATRGLRR